MAAALATLADFGFRVPQMAGLGDHWPLDDREARNWGKSLEGCLKSLPNKSKQAAIKAISRWIPWIALTMTGYITIVPRIMMTNMQGRMDRGSQTPARGAEGPDGEIRRPSRPPDGAHGGILSWEDFRRDA